MKTNNNIDKIHTSPFTLRLIERGAGMAVSSLLCSRAGASQTVYSAESPYSTSSFERSFGITESRAVSYENLLFLYNNKQIQSDLQNNLYSHLFLSSWQIKELPASTHGWILIASKDRVRLYHISFHTEVTRLEVIRKSGEYGLALLSHFLFSSKTSAIPIDIVLDGEGKPLIDETLGYLYDCDKELSHMLCFRADKKIIRVEELYRKYETLVIYKGSFSPVTAAHEEIIRYGEKAYKNGGAIFALSIDTYQKGLVDRHGLIEKIEDLNELGYDVILFTHPYFFENAALLQTKFQGQIVFLLGVDTLSRLLSFYWNESDDQLDRQKFLADFAKVKFLCAYRANCELPTFYNAETQSISNIEYFEIKHAQVSSTEVRRLIQEGRIEDAKKSLPQGLAEKIIERYI